MTVKHLIWIFLAFFAACQQKEQKTERSNALVGSWKFEKIEFNTGEPVDINDSVYANLHKQHIGLTFDFTNDNDFTVTQPKPNDPKGFIAQQKYELPEGSKTLVLKNTGRPDDMFPIIELSDTTFRIDVFRSGWGYLVFRKKP